jgi:hypothetical protein
MIAINDYLLEIVSTYDKHEKRIRSFLKMDYNEEAVILIVTIFEVFFRDLFRITHELWFPQYCGGSIDCLPISESIKARKQIRNYLKSIKAYDEFLGNYFVFESQKVDATKNSIFATFFDDNEKMNYLNFQILNEDKGVRVAYKIFFDIDIMMLLDADRKESQQKWKKLIKLFKDRHAIVHKGKNTQFSKEEITELLNSLDFLKSNVMKKILTPYSGSIK